MNQTKDGHIITGLWCQSCSVVPVTKDGIMCGNCWEHAYNNYKKLMHYRAYSTPMRVALNYIPQSRAPTDFN